MINKLNSDESCIIKSEYENDESDLSEIYVEDEIDCSSFVTFDDKPKSNLNYEDSFDFEQFIVNDCIKILKEKAFVFPKVQSTPNQVFLTKGLDKSSTNDLTSMVKNDNNASCEYRFWYEPIDNNEETIGFSEKYHGE